MYQQWNYQSNQRFYGNQRPPQPRNKLGCLVVVAILGLVFTVFVVTAALIIRDMGAVMAEGPVGTEYLVCTELVRTYDEDEPYTAKCSDSRGNTYTITMNDFTDAFRKSGSVTVDVYISDGKVYFGYSNSLIYVCDEYEYYD